MASSLAHQKSKHQQDEDDDWETDADFVNDVSEKEGRWGSKTVQGSGHQEDIKIDELRSTVIKNAEAAQLKVLEGMPKASEGYGGKFGVLKDRQDSCAESWSYQGKVDPHNSQKDYKKGFGGEFGIQSDRKDLSAFGWDEKAPLSTHASQKDYSIGFGGTYGVQKDRMDLVALGWDSKEKAEKHGSQLDYKKGFGGEFGIQSDRKDQKAFGWDEKEKLQQHESQTDYKKGFGGQFGIQSDRKDKSAHGWEKVENPIVSSQKDTSVEQAARGNASNLRNKFEQMALQQKNQDLQRATEERERRMREDEELKHRQAVMEADRQQKLEAEEEEESLGESAQHAVEPEHRPVMPRSRPKIGVALPYATTKVQQNGEEESPPPKPVRSMVIEESELPEGIDEGSQHQSLPPVNLLLTPSAISETNAASLTLSPISFDPVSLREAQVAHEYEEPRRFVDEPVLVQSESEYTQCSQGPLGVCTTNEGQPVEMGSGLRAIALFSYEKSDADEIEFEVNDLITDIEQIDPGWWRGFCKGAHGLFPANYVQLID